MTPAAHANAIEDAIVEYGEACIGNALQPSRETKARCLRAHRALRSVASAGVGAVPPKDSAEFALAALVAAGHVSQHQVDYARSLMPEGGYVPKAAPEGWQLVPVEPTNAMLDALEEGGCSEGNYKAALAASPKP